MLENFEEQNVSTKFISEAAGVSSGLANIIVSDKDNRIITGFESLAAPGTSLMAGSPEQVVEKIMCQHELYGHNKVPRTDGYRRTAF